MTPEIHAMSYAKEIGEALHKAYPGHLWHVEPSGDFSMLSVCNLNLSARYGFNVPLKGPQALGLESVGKKAVMVGGELLERYRVDRGRGGLEQAKTILHERQGRFEADHDAG